MCASEAQMAHRLCIQLLTLNSVLSPLLMAFSTFTSLNEDVFRETVFKRNPRKPLNWSHVHRYHLHCGNLGADVQARTPRQRQCLLFFVWELSVNSVQQISMQSHLSRPNYLHSTSLSWHGLFGYCLPVAYLGMSLRSPACSRQCSPPLGKTKTLDVNVSMLSW